MSKRSIFHLVSTVFMLLLSMILLLLPGDIGKIVKMFLPVLFFSILAGMMNHWFSGVTIGVLTPLLLFLILRKESFSEEVIYQMISFSFAAVTASTIYQIFKSSVGASILAVLSSRIILLLSRIVGHYMLSSSYTLSDYIEEAIKSCYPGILLSLILIPLLIFIFRKRGIMKISRNESED